MIIINKLRTIGLVTVLAGIIAGCAGTTEQATTAGPSAADAIAAAKAANAKAKEENYEWRDTGKLIKKAEEALKAGDNAKAIKLAEQAKRQAENAVAQKYEQLERLKKEGIIGGDQPAAAEGQYQVNKGDNLWNISGNSSVYGNPYQWPLIYKTNQDKIKDADLIYPGQVLNIDHSVSSADIDAAVHHAKTRGSWSLGKVEASDKAYLGM